MGLLAEAKRSSGAGRAAAAEALAREIEARAFLFPEDGGWLPLMRKALAQTRG